MHRTQWIVLYSMINVTQTKVVISNIVVTEILCLYFANFFSEFLVDDH
jgi:hypothetical protein